MGGRNLDRLLPLEVLHDIFSYLAVPDNFFSIGFLDPEFLPLPGESLAQVSSYWRSVSIGCSVLFATTDWMKWPIEKLRVWAERGAKAGLSVFVVFDQKDHGTFDEDRLELIRSFCHVWRILNVIIKTDPASHPKISSLFIANTPRLHTVTVERDLRMKTRTITNISPEFAPNVRVLNLYDGALEDAPRWPRLESVTAVYCAMEDLTWKSLEPLQDSQLLMLRSCRPPTSPPPPSILFKNLGHLDIIIFDDGAFLRNVLTQNLAPNLHTLELVLNYKLSVTTKLGPLVR